MSVRTSQKRLLFRTWRLVWMKVPIRNAAIGALVGGMLFGLGFAGTRTSAGGAVAHYLVTSVMHSDSGSLQSPVVGNDAVTGLLTDPTPSPVDVTPPVTPDPGAVVIGVPSGPVYPVVNGAPCIPPGVVTGGNCAVPPGYVPPPSTNPAANQPGEGAPCLPPGVLTGNSCAVPQPSPAPTPVATPTPVAAAASPSPSPSPVPSP